MASAGPRRLVRLVVVAALLMASACSTAPPATVDSADGATAAPTVTAESSPVPETASTPSKTVAATSAPEPTPTPEPTPGPPDPPDLTKSPSVFFAPVPAQLPGANLPLPDGAMDFMDMFAPGAQWDDAASHIDGFKLHSWMITHYLSDAELITIYTGLRDRGIPLIIEAEPLNPPNPAECDHNESFEGPFEIRNLQRLKGLGIEVAMIAIEQPYSIAHRLEGPGACQYEVSRILDEIIPWIAQAREIYPDVPVGSIEAVWADPLTTPEQFALWLDSYEEASGEKFAFINLDPNFNWSGWGEVARGIEQVADDRGIPFGILYNGNIRDTNDQYLLEIAREFAYYENDLGGTPDQVYIQSWHALPDRLLPDDDVGAMTGLVNRYFGERSVFEAAELTVGADGPIVTGRLVSSNGTPLSGQIVDIQALPLNGPLQSATVSGTVPAGATNALVAIRVNAEDAVPGETTTTMYSVRYTEDASGQNLVPNGDFAEGLSSWGVYGEPLGNANLVSTPAGPAIELIATSSQQIWIDGAQFAVTPRADFDFTIDFGAPQGTAGTVTVAIIFLDVSESSRSTIVVGPRPVNDGWTVQTKNDGTYVVELGDLDAGRYELEIRTDGDANTWVGSTTQIIEVFER